MSPEQIRRPKQVDTRTDNLVARSICSSFSRDPPFNADSPLALLRAVVSDPLPSVADKRPDVPLALEAVIAKCLLERIRQPLPNSGGAWRMRSHRLRRVPSRPCRASRASCAPRRLRRPRTSRRRRSAPYKAPAGPLASSRPRAAGQGRDAGSGGSQRKKIPGTTGGDTVTVASLGAR